MWKKYVYDCIKILLKSGWKKLPQANLKGKYHGSKSFLMEAEPLRVPASEG